MVILDMVRSRFTKTAKFLTFGKNITYLSREVGVTFTTIYIITFDVFYTKFLNFIHLPGFYWLSCLKTLLAYHCESYVGRSTYLMDLFNNHQPHIIHRTVAHQAETNMDPKLRRGV
jgi:hypothetical protein